MRARWRAVVIVIVALGPGLAPAQSLPDGQRTGSHFMSLPSNPFRAPQVRVLDVPGFADANSIWGATGRDVEGRIWIGVSAKHPGGSAHLMQFDPRSDQWIDRGAVVDALAAMNRLRPGEGQVKMHSKIVPADDGRLYFTSMDEEGEAEDGSALPKWGSHLWRIDPQRGQWEHLLDAPEGLVAASAGGRYVYALGYWGHVLYQYDTVTGGIRRAVVGAAGGHASRNVIAWLDGHAFVPRLAAGADGKLTAVLVEFDPDLQEIGATALDHYGDDGDPAADHGIVGLAYLANGRIVFTTHQGYLRLIEPRSGAAAVVSSLGWFHPEGRAYAPSLFSFDGQALLAGVTERNGRHEWVVFDIDSRVVRAFALDTGNVQGPLLYGSITRDDAGRFYVGGWQSVPGGGHRPLLLQIDPGR